VARRTPDLAPTIPLVVFEMFQLKFAVITPALITGSFAERVRFSAYLVFICLFSVFIYCPLAHWTWHPQGFLRQWGILDFAGGTVVHMSAGFAALAGAMVLGRRRNHEDGGVHVPSNIPYVLLGTGMLWFGWFGIGAVVGLVAITPAAGFVSIPHSIFIGVAASIASNVAVHLRSRSTLDDTLDVFPCHGLGGIVGMILTGVLARDVGLLSGHTTTFMYHLVALVIVSAFSFLGSLD